MSDNIPDPFEMIRREAQAAEPSQDQLLHARQRLQAAILNEQKTARRPARRWLLPSLATVLLLLVVGGVAFFRPTPAEAALAEIAEAARTASPIDVPQGSFIYTRSERIDLAIRPGVEFGLDHEFVAYLLPSTRKVWRQPETEFIQIHTTNNKPTFFDPNAEAAYYRHGLDATDRLDEVQTERLTGVTDPILDVDWPTEPDALYEALRDYVAQGGDERPEAVQVFDLATDLLRETDRSPQSRAAIFDLLAQLPVDLVERTASAITISITHTTPTPTQHTITLNPAGLLLSETSTLLAGDQELGIPADTAILSVDYEETRIADDL
ncbi:MAG TPA: hypothetical protein VF148_02820 [Acidimicrobiia bacterium]